LRVLARSVAGDLAQAVSAAREAAVRAAARRLMRATSLRPSLDALTDRGLGRVACLGDSLTADELSWAEILGQAFRLLRPARATSVVNLGIGGDTTVHLVSRFAAVMATDPDVVIALAGTNDARRHGRSEPRMLVPDHETRRNLELLRRLTLEETKASIWLITPPPVLEERIVAAPALVRERVSWRSSDVDQKAAVVRRLGGQVIDSRAVLRPPLSKLLRSDGLHLTLAGQERLARRVLECLAQGERAPPTSLTRRRL
jgi:lysophospholipase L1-like esterase